MRQLSLDDPDMETLSYGVMQGLRDHSRQCHEIINKELMLREALKDLLGLDRDMWNTLVQKAADNAGFSHADLDPFRVFKDVRNLCSVIALRSSDPFARTIAERIVESIGETLVEDIVTLEQQVRNLVEGEEGLNGAS